VGRISLPHGVCSYEDCEGRLALYLDGYNFQRPHQALQGLTPADRFFGQRRRCARSGSAGAGEFAAPLAAAAAQKPFYIVGKLGDRDVTISAARDEVRGAVWQGSTADHLAAAKRRPTMKQKESGRHGRGRPPGG